MRIYISGKIGEEVISEATRQKFAKAEAMLKAKGYDVMNPACEEYQAEMNQEVDIEEKKWADEGCGEKFDRYAHILLYDLRVLNICDAVYFLHDSKKSPGARSEYYFSLAIKKPIFFAEREDARNHLSNEFWRLADEGTLAQKYYDIESWADALDEYLEDHKRDIWLPIE